MYGQSAWTHYQKIADIEIDSDDPSDAKPYRVRKAKSTVFAFAKHPVARGLENKYWVRLGKEISIQSNSNRRLRS
jgi:hypothetical protein